MDWKTVFLNNKIIVLYILFIIVIMISQNFKWTDQRIERSIIEVSAGNCPAQHQICTVKLDEFIIGISFDKNIYYLKKFDVSVWTENKESADIESIHIDFKMNNMNMGVNRFMLTKVNSKNNKQQWQGKALLPICVTGRADWFSELEIMTKQNKYILTFPLQVKRTSN